MYIDYKEQPTDMTCGQTCVAMIMWVEVDEVIKVMKKKGGTYSKDLIKAFQHYGVKTSPGLIRRKKNSPLPDLCILKLRHSKIKGSHWAIYHSGVYYDPSLGMLEKYPNEITITSYLQIEEPVINYEEKMKK